MKCIVVSYNKLCVFLVSLFCRWVVVVVISSREDCVGERGRDWGGDIVKFLLVW